MTGCRHLRYHKTATTETRPVQIEVPRDSVYTAPTQEATEERFLEFTEAWGKKYPAITKLWSDA